MKEFRETRVHKWKQIHGCIVHNKIYNMTSESTVNFYFMSTLSSRAFFWTSSTCVYRTQAYLFLKVKSFKGHLLSAEWASIREKGVLPCLTSQIHSIPSCPPVATMCCWFGCLSTQCKGTLSPVLHEQKMYETKIRQQKREQLTVQLLDDLEWIQINCTNFWYWDDWLKTVPNKPGQFLILGSWNIARKNLYQCWVHWKM